MILRDYSWTELRLKCMEERKRLIFWGAGRLFFKFKNDYVECVEHIDAIVDKDSSKWGESLRYSNNEIRIISSNQFKEMNKTGYILVISCLDAVAVYEELNQDLSYERLECCILSFIRGKQADEEDANRYYPETFRLRNEQLIPKKIHYCWFGGKPLPENNRRWIDSWRKWCPDYEIIEWNESNYDVNKVPFMKQAYKMKKWGYVPDYARLDIIYNNGGIYLDTDVEVVRNLDDLLYQEAFVGTEASKMINLGSGFGAKKGHSLICEMLEIYENSIFGKNTFPAPEMMTPFFERKGFIKSGEFQTLSGGITVYPAKVMSGKNIYTGRLTVTDYTCTVHHYDASWFEEKKYEQRKKLTELYEKFINE